MSHPTTCCCIQSTVLQIILEWMNGKKKKKEKIIFRGRSIWTALLGSWDFWLLVFSKKKKKKKKEGIFYSAVPSKKPVPCGNPETCCVSCVLFMAPHMCSLSPFPTCHVTPLLFYSFPSVQNIPHWHQLRYLNLVNFLLELLCFYRFLYNLISLNSPLLHYFWSNNPTMETFSSHT